MFLRQALYVVKSGLELAIPLPQPPECWSYRCVPAGLVGK